MDLVWRNSLQNRCNGRKPCYAKRAWKLLQIPCIIFYVQFSHTEHGSCYNYHVPFSMHNFLIESMEVVTTTMYHQLNQPFLSHISVSFMHLRSINCVLLLLYSYPSCFSSGVSQSGRLVKVFMKFSISLSHFPNHPYEFIQDSTWNSKW